MLMGNTLCQRRPRAPRTIMRVVLNALFLIPNRVGGSETYLRGLVEGLAHIDAENEYILCVGPESAPTFHLPSERWRLVVSPAPSANRPARIVLEQSWLPLMARYLGADILHSTGYTAPLFPGLPSMVSILDMNYKRHPEDLSGAERLVYSVLVSGGARLCDHVLTLSRAAGDDIVRWTGVPPSKITVIHLAPRADWPGSSPEDAKRVNGTGLTGP